LDIQNDFNQHSLSSLSSLRRPRDGGGAPARSGGSGPESAATGPDLAVPGGRVAPQAPFTSTSSTRPTAAGFERLGSRLGAADPSSRGLSGAMAARVVRPQRAARRHIRAARVQPVVGVPRTEAREVSFGTARAPAAGASEVLYRRDLRPPSHR
ncbi:unnamed protein product, partial [Urochloa humidicola]